MWIWYFDRQGIIYSQGMSFIQDLPRFLVLLSAFQGFDLADWGVISIFNPNAKRAHQTAIDVTDASADYLSRGLLTRGISASVSVFANQSLNCLMMIKLAAATFPSQVKGVIILMIE